MPTENNNHTNNSLRVYFKNDNSKVEKQRIAIPEETVLGLGLNLLAFSLYKSHIKYMNLISSRLSMFHEKQKQFLSQIVNKSEEAIKNTVTSKFGLDISKYNIAGAYNFSVDYTQTITGLGLSFPSDKELNTEVLINLYVIKNLEKNISEISKINTQNISDTDAKNIMAHEVVIHEILHKLFSVEAYISFKHPNDLLSNSFSKSTKEGLVQFFTLIVSRQYFKENYDLDLSISNLLDIEDRFGSYPEEVKNILDFIKRLSGKLEIQRANPGTFSKENANSKRMMLEMQLRRSNSSFSHISSDYTTKTTDETKFEMRSIDESSYKNHDSTSIVMTIMANYFFAGSNEIDLLCEDLDELNILK